MVKQTKKETPKKVEKNIESKSKLVKQGSKVKLDYEGKLETGEIFDTSKHGDHSHPLEFTVGNNQVIPGFEKAVIGMAKGDKKEFTIEPKEAYGEAREELKQEIPKSALPQGPEPKPGMILILNAPDGQQFPVKIAEIKKDTIVLDMNHPLAGKKLIFSIEILEVN